MSDDSFAQDTGCILHPSCLTCPEPICAFEFPGGIKAYIKYKEMQAVLNQGVDLHEAARRLGATSRQTKKLFHSSRIIMSHG